MKQAFIDGEMQKEGCFDAIGRSKEGCRRRNGQQKKRKIECSDT